MKINETRIIGTTNKLNEGATVGEVEELVKKLRKHRNARIKKNVLDKLGIKPETYSDTPKEPSVDDIIDTVDYLTSNNKIRNIIMSGGTPLFDEVSKLLMESTHAPQQVKLKESRIVQFDEFVNENQKELDFSKQTYTRKEVINMLEDAYAEAAGSYNDYGMNSSDPSIIKSAKEFVKKYMNEK